MQAIEARIPEVKLFKPTVYGEERGFFIKTWQRHKFSEAVIDYGFVQDNHSRSIKDTLGDLHYQAPHHA